jgi:hypothetical protein
MRRAVSSVTLAAVERGLATAGFTAVAADPANFAAGGCTLLVGTKTN